MSKTQDRDIITYQQDIFRIIRDKKALEYLNDIRLGLVLKFLRKGPMTLEDLEINFKEANEERSIPSLYRYLQKLGKAGLVIQAGKRIITDKTNQIKTQTLYLRTAKLFFEDITYKIYRMDKEDSERKKHLIRAIGLLLGQRFDNKKASKEALNDLIVGLHKRQQEMLEEILQNINGKNVDFIAALDYNDINYVLDTTFWLSLLTEGTSWREKLLACFSED